MKWLSNLLRKPAAKSTSPTARPPVVQVVKPVVNVDALRREMSGASDENGRRTAAVDLGRALAASAQSPLGDDPPEVWVAAVIHATDRQQARQWLDTVSGDARLSEVATHGRIAEVRLTAAQRVVDSSVLKSIAGECRDKDKSVYRYCTETLRQRQRAIEQARQAAEFEAALTVLLAASPLPLLRLLALEKEYQQLPAEVTGDAGFATCEALFAEARSRLQQETLARRELPLTEAAIETLHAECAAAEVADAATLDGWQTRQEDLDRALKSLPVWLDTGRSAERLSSIERRLALLAADTSGARACQEFLAALTPEAAASGESDSVWEGLPKPQHLPSRDSLEARWRALRFPVAEVVASTEQPEPPALPAPVVSPDAPARPLDAVALRGSLDQLEKCIEEGHLVRAEAINKEVEAITAGVRVPPPLDHRLQHTQALLGELRAWARWSTLQARDRLVLEAESLATSGHSAEALAAEVVALRDEWKRLNVHGPSSKSQWEAFDAALEKAYEPVTALRAEEAARQAAARAERQTLCAEWEAWLAGIAWPQADFPAIELRRQEMIKQWRQAPRLGFRDERLLRKRFDSLIADLDANLDRVRRQEADRLEQIIVAAEGLIALADPTKAASEAKALQQRWRDETGPLRLKRSEEQKLWQRFRSACDAVFMRREAEFSRRDAVRAEAAAHRNQQQQVRQECVDAFAAVLASSETKDIKAELGQFRHAWSGLRGSDRAAPDGLDRRAQELQQLAQKRLDEGRRQKIRSRYELMARKAELIAAVEAAAISGNADAAQEARQAWSQLPRLPGKAEALLGQRLSAADEALADTLEHGRAVCGELLLDLEIELDLPTPEFHLEQRRARQIARLKERFGRHSPDEAENLLVRWYATAASVLPESLPRIAAVVEKLVEKSYSAHP